jgi:hypothetical protein
MAGMFLQGGAVKMTLPCSKSGGIITALLLLTIVSFTPADASEVIVPDCATLKEWIVQLDPEEVWIPVKESSAWLPEAFRDPAFEQLFGVPALSWNQKDAEAMDQQLFQCGTQAGEAGRSDIRMEFYRAQRWFKSNLIAVLLAQSQTETAAQRKKIASKSSPAKAPMAEAADTARKSALSRGGDPDLIGYVYHNPDSSLSVRFIDEKHAGITMNGIENDAPYQSTADEVVVYAPFLTIRFTRKGIGSKTELEWMGKAYRRAGESSSPRNGSI